MNMSDGGSVTIDCGSGSLFEHTLNDDDLAGDYPANANYQITICPDGTNGSKVRFDIDSGLHQWQVDGSDTLYVFDGPSTGAPLLGAFNSNTHPTGMSVVASLDNASGCLTFQFVSDGAVQDEGFFGIVQCSFPCQPFTPSITSVPPLIPSDTGYVDICLGTTVTFTGGGDFPYSGTNGGIGYDQTVGTSTFNWAISDGTTFSDTQSFDFTPTEHAGYFVDLQMIDAMGCVEIMRAKIRVSTLPDFSELATVLDDTICPGESSIVIGGFDANGDPIGFEPTVGSFISGGNFAGETYLPDGGLSNYTTEILITQFDTGQVITSGSDVMDVCLVIEHSWLGDLEMTLTCPNGTTLDLFNSYNGPSANQLSPGGFGGGGIFLGDPIDNNQQVPGVGWEYCFSDNASWGTLGQELALGNTVTAPTENGASMTPGTYLPEESYDGFIGCPLNGTWTVTVRDNLLEDNGFIFEWGIEYDPDIDPNSEYFTPEIVNAFWSPDPTIVAELGDSAIQVTPMVPGDYSYTLNIEDNFGCAYDTTVNVHLVPPLGSFESESVCAMDFDLEAADIEILGEWSYSGPVGGSATFSPSINASNSNVTVSEFGEYQFVFESQYCGQSDTVVIDFNPTPSPVNLADQTICPGTDLTFDAGNEDIGATYLWSPGGSADQVLELDSITATTGVQVTVTNDCGTANGAATITVHTLSVSGPLEVCLQDEADLFANFTTTSGTWSYTGPDGSTAAFSPNEQSASPSVTVDEAGTYQFVFTDDQCSMQRIWEVTFAPAPTIELALDTNRICIEDEVAIWYTTNTDFYDSFEWNPYSMSTDDTLVIAGTDSLAYNPIDTLFYVSASISNFCGTGEDVIAYQVIDCNLDVPNVFNPESSIPENQYFNIVALNLHPGNNVKIFDRWGRKCYDVDNYHLNPWNGGKESDGVFYYVLKRPGYDPEIGFVHLVRGS